MQLDIWSDVMCPWCAIGRAHLEEALARFVAAEGLSDDAIAVRWRSFELDPTAPRVVEGDYAAKLGAKYGTSREQARAMMDAMAERAASEGLHFDFSRIRPGNTFDAHRLLHHAWERGRQDALKERLLRAYLSEGEAVGTHEVLQRLAEEVGLDGAEVAEVLASDRHAADVRAEERMAAQLGIRGVPFFVLDGRLGVSGAQPVEVLVSALSQAWHSREPAATVEGGEACGPDGCALPEG